MATKTGLRYWALATTLAFLAACGGGGGGGGQPPSTGGGNPGPSPTPIPDVAGTWQIEEALTDNCPSGSGNNSYVATVTQSGASVVVTYGGINRSGTMDGNVLRWSGSYPEDGGTTTVSSLVLTFSGATAAGSAQWSWTDGTQSCSGTSAITATRIAGGGIAVPSGLNAVATSSGSIDLMWQDNADNEDAYLVERSAVSATTDFSIVATLPADSQSFGDTGLTPATTYYYRVAASNATAQSEYSNVTSAFTDAPPIQPPAAPSSLNGSATSSTSAQLFWTDNSGNESNFEIFQALGASAAFSLVRTVAANQTSATIDGLSPGTDYAFKVVATNSAGRSVDSNTLRISTPVDVTVPNAPTAPSVDSATSSSLTVRWTDQSDNETGFRVYRSASRDSGYTEIAVATASSTSYTNTGLAPSTTYWYRVSAFNDAGESALTAPVSGSTEAPPVTTPPVPSGLAVGSATSSSLTLSWTDSSDNETGFRIYRARSSTGTYTEVAITRASVTSFTDSGLSASTSYWYRISAFNSAGESAQTRAVGGTTLAPPVTVPAAPTDPGIANVRSSSATLVWTDNADNETGFQIGNCSGPVSISSNNVVTCISGFTQIAQVGPDVTSYAISGLRASTEYRLFVRAYNSAGNSANTGVTFTTTAGQQTVTLSATATNAVISNSLDSSTANTAFPNSFPAVGINWDFSLTGFPSSVAFAALVRYDVAPLQGRNILSATLSLEARTAPVGFLPQNFDIGTVATAWDPSTVTWNEAANFFYYNAGWQRNIAYPTFSGRTYDIDLTSVVQNWADGLFENHGIGLLSSNYSASPGNQTSFDAYDFFVPTLTVIYE